MWRQTALALLLAGALGSPALLAQPQTGAAGPARPGPRLVMRSLQLRVQRGVRMGRITPAELARLRGDIAAFRAKAQAMRQAGTPLTRAQRQDLRQGLRRLNREIFVANHNREGTGPSASAGSD